MRCFPVTGRACKRSDHVLWPPTQEKRDLAHISRGGPGGGRGPIPEPGSDHHAGHVSMIRQACATLALFLAIVPSAIAHADQGTDLRGADSYTVQAGDTLFGIATRAGVDLDTLVRINHLSSADDTIYAGSILRLRDTGAA